MKTQVMYLSLIFLSTLFLTTGCGNSNPPIDLPEEAEDLEQSITPVQIPSIDASTTTAQGDPLSEFEDGSYLFQIDNITIKLTIGMDYNEALTELDKQNMSYSFNKFYSNDSDQFDRAAKTTATERTRVDTKYFILYFETYAAKKQLVEFHICSDLVATKVGLKVQDSFETAKLLYGKNYTKYNLDDWEVAYVYDVGDNNFCYYGICEDEDNPDEPSSIFWWGLKKKRN